MAKQALIVFGGWDGHEPEAVSNIFERVLKDDGFAVRRENTLDAFADETFMASVDLVVPVWTMGQIGKEQLAGVVKAVAAGTGMAGCHGGMCDSFRTETEWQFLTGGQWVAHPGNDGVDYTVQLRPHQLTAGLPSEFAVKSEQYYLHVDPAITVLGTTRFPVVAGPHDTNGPVEMPTFWTKHYGKGRVFYSALGHSAAVVESEPHLTLMRRGFAWATR